MNPNNRVELTRNVRSHVKLADRTDMSFTESLGRGVGRETMNEVQSRLDQLLKRSWDGVPPGYRQVW